MKKLTYKEAEKIVEERIESAFNSLVEMTANGYKKFHN